MSYDLHVWDENVPAGAAPSDQMRRFLANLLARCPDDDEPPNWSAGPLDVDSDDIAYLSMPWSQADRVGRIVKAEAFRLGLACYDPQIDQMAY